MESHEVERIEVRRRTSDEFSWPGQVDVLWTSAGLGLSSLERDLGKIGVDWAAKR
jgi:hypothetical protein